MSTPRMHGATRALLIASLTAVLAMPQMTLAQQGFEDPSALAMASDLIIARPVGLVTTVIGSALYVVSLPFSLAGGNAKAAANTLVIGPARTTFVRCLGCTQPGYQRDPTPHPEA